MPPSASTTATPPSTRSSQRTLTSLLRPKSSTASSTATAVSPISTSSTTTATSPPSPSSSPLALFSPAKRLPRSSPHPHVVTSIAPTSYHDYPSRASYMDNYSDVESLEESDVGGALDEPSEKEEVVEEAEGTEMLMACKDEDDTRTLHGGHLPATPTAFDATTTATTTATPTRAHEVWSVEDAITTSFLSGSGQTGSDPQQEQLQHIIPSPSPSSASSISSTDSLVRQDSTGPVHTHDFWSETDSEQEEVLSSLGRTATKSLPVIDSGNAASANSTHQSQSTATTSSQHRHHQYTSTPISTPTPTPPPLRRIRRPLLKQSTLDQIDDDHEGEVGASQSYDDARSDRASDEEEDEEWQEELIPYEPPFSRYQVFADDDGQQRNSSLHHHQRDTSVHLHRNLQLRNIQIHRAASLTSSVDSTATECERNPVTAGSGAGVGGGGNGIKSWVAAKLKSKKSACRAIPAVDVDAGAGAGAGGGVPSSALHGSHSSCSIRVREQDGRKEKTKEKWLSLKLEWPDSIQGYNSPSIIKVNSRGKEVERSQGGPSLVYYRRLLFDDDSSGCDSSEEERDRRGGELTSGGESGKERTGRVMYHSICTHPSYTTPLNRYMSPIEIHTGPFVHSRSSEETTSLPMWEALPSYSGSINKDTGSPPPSQPPPLPPLPPNKWKIHHPSSGFTSIVREEDLTSLSYSFLAPGPSASANSSTLDTTTISSYLIKGPSHSPVIHLQGPSPSRSRSRPRSSGHDHHHHHMYLYELAHFDGTHLTLHINLSLCSRSSTDIELVLVIFETFMALKDESASAVFCRRDERGRLRFERGGKLRGAWDRLLSL